MSSCRATTQGRWSRGRRRCTSFSVSTGIVWASPSTSLNLCSRLKAAEHICWWSRSIWLDMCHTGAITTGLPLRSHQVNHVQNDTNKLHTSARVRQVGYISDRLCRREFTAATASFLIWSWIQWFMFCAAVSNLRSDAGLCGMRDGVVMTEWNRGRLTRSYEHLH